MDLLNLNDTPGQYPPSYYAATAKGMKKRSAALGDMTADVCIIGGGYTGLSSALHLSKRGYKVIILEANRIGWGASGRNGGQVNTGMRLDQDVLEENYGLSTAKSLHKLAEQAVDLVKQLIKDNDIVCGFKPGIVHAMHKARYMADERALIEKMQNSYGVETLTFLNRDALQELVPSPLYHGGALDMAAGHLHPLNYALGLADAAEKQGAILYEDSRVLSIDEGEKIVFRTQNATIHARYGVIGTNGYSGSLERNIARHVMPINGFIAATRPLSDMEVQGVLRKNFAVADSKFVVNYFRLSEDNRLLFGGGETYGYKFPRNIDAVVRKPLSEVYPQLKNIEFDYCWGGTLGITMSRMPFFKRHSGNLLSACGFSGQGVALATFAGQVIAETIAGQAERFDILANLPASPFPGGKRLQTPLLILAMTWYALRDRL